MALQWNNGHLLWQDSHLMIGDCCCNSFDCRVDCCPWYVAYVANTQYTTYPSFGGRDCHWQWYEYGDCKGWGTHIYKDNGKWVFELRQTNNDGNNRYIRWEADDNGGCPPTYELTDLPIADDNDARWTKTVSDAVFPNAKLVLVPMCDCCQIIHINGGGFMYHGDLYPYGFAGTMYMGASIMASIVYNPTTNIWQLWYGFPPFGSIYTSNANCPPSGEANWTYVSGGDTLTELECTGVTRTSGYSSITVSVNGTSYTMTRTSGVSFSGSGFSLSYNSTTNEWVLTGINGWEWRCRAIGRFAVDVPITSGGCQTTYAPWVPQGSSPELTGLYG